MNLSKICVVVIFIVDLKISFLSFILGNKTMDLSFCFFNFFNRLKKKRTSPSQFKVTSVFKVNSYMYLKRRVEWCAGE